MPAPEPDEFVIRHERGPARLAAAPHPNPFPARGERESVRVAPSPVRRPGSRESGPGSVFLANDSTRAGPGAVRRGPSPRPLTASGERGFARAARILPPSPRRGGPA